MAEEKNMDNRKYAIPGVSAFIFNDRGELLLTRSPQWANQWVVPGGKVEFGEKMEETLKREMKEEINLDIKNIEYLITIELVKTKERPDLHLVVTEFVAKAENNDVKINGEHSEFSWRKPEDWLEDKDLYPGMKEVIEYYLNEFLVKKDLENKYKRALADYQNLIKQTIKEKQEFAIYANEQIILDILPVYDHLKMALTHADKENSNGWLEGVKNVVKQFADTLKNLGVEEIKTLGENFDHNIMDAVSDEETGAKELEGTVAKEAKAGYKLKGKVIQPASVIVYKLKK